MSSSASDMESGSEHASSGPDFAPDEEEAAAEKQQAPAKRRRAKAPSKPRAKRRAKAQPAAAVPGEKRHNPVDIENMLISDVQPQPNAIFAMEQALYYIQFSATRVLVT